MIESRSNPRIKALSALIKKKKARDEEGVFVVEGRRMFMEAPDEGIKEIYVSKSFLEQFKNEPGIGEKLERCGYEVLSNEVFRSVSDTQTPQGIMCIVRQMKYDIEEVISGPSPFLLFAEDIQDPGNLGTMIRSGEGAGITGVLMTDNTVDIYNPKTIRSTMGSVFRTKFCHVPDMKAAVDMAKSAGIKVYAAHLKGKRVYDEPDYKGPCGIIVGNEGAGITEETALAATELIKIPMKGRVESLNAAVAATVIMYEIARQRR